MEILEINGSKLNSGEELSNLINYSLSRNADPILIKYKMGFRSKELLFYLMNYDNTSLTPDDACNRCVLFKMNKEKMTKYCMDGDSCKYRKVYLTTDYKSEQAFINTLKLSRIGVMIEDRINEILTESICNDSFCAYYDICDHKGKYSNSDVLCNLSKVLDSSRTKLFWLSCDIKDLLKL